MASSNMKMRVTKTTGKEIEFMFAHVVVFTSEKGMAPRLFELILATGYRFNNLLPTLRTETEDVWRLLFLYSLLTLF